MRQNVKIPQKALCAVSYNAVKSFTETRKRFFTAYAALKTGFGDFIVAVYSD